MNDVEKLRVLLPHWMEHNQEHAADFLAWADKSALAGHEGVQERIRSAADAIRRANADLRLALEDLGGPLSEESHPDLHQH